MSSHVQLLFKRLELDKWEITLLENKESSKYVLHQILKSQKLLCGWLHWHLS